MTQNSSAPKIVSAPFIVVLRKEQAAKALKRDDGSNQIASVQGDAQ